MVLKLTRVATPPAPICHLLVYMDRCEALSLSRSDWWLVSSLYDLTQPLVLSVVSFLGNDMWACASAYHQTGADRWVPFLTLVSLTALYPAGAHYSFRSLHPWALQVLASGAQRVWLGLLSSLCRCCQKSAALRGDLIKAGVLRWTVVLECMR